jgi:hypothetical protein
MRELEWILISAGLLLWIPLLARIAAQRWCCVPVFGRLKRCFSCFLAGDPCLVGCVSAERIVDPFACVALSPRNYPFNHFIVYSSGFWLRESAACRRFSRSDLRVRFWLRL